MLDAEYIVDVLERAFLQGNSTHNCSLFYILWFLSRVEERSELNKTFSRFCIFLDEAWKYLTIIYSLNITKAFNSGMLNKLKRGEMDKKLKIICGNKLNICKGISRLSHYCAPRDPKSIVEIEKRTKAFSYPKPVMEVCWMILKEQAKIIGGVNFFSTPKVLLRRLNGDSMIFFIDACWHLHHATGSVLTWGFTNSRHNEELMKILEAKRNGDLMYLYDYAVNVMPSLRDYKFMLRSGFKGQVFSKYLLEEGWLYRKDVKI